MHYKHSASDNHLCRRKILFCPLVSFLNMRRRQVLVSKETLMWALNNLVLLLTTIHADMTTCHLENLYIGALSSSEYPSELFRVLRWLSNTEERSSKCIKSEPLCKRELQMEFGCPRSSMCEISQAVRRINAL